MGKFFIDTRQGAVATQRQLMQRGIAGDDGVPPKPWHRIQGTDDATTLWYAVMRRQEKGIFIGSLVIRHSNHHALLMQRGWQEVPVEEIGEAAPSPWSAQDVADQAM